MKDLEKSVKNLTQILEEKQESMNLFIEEIAEKTATNA